MGKSLGSRVNEDVMGEIKTLDMEEKKKFDGLLIYNLYNRYWCRVNGIDYVNPSIPKVKEKTYNEMVRYGLVKGKDK